MTKKKPDDVINDVEDTPQAPTLPPALIPGLTAGRMVHYVFGQDAHRPAIITRVLDPIEGIVNLNVFFDGSTDGRSFSGNTEWVSNVEYSEFSVDYTWHFIEKA